jgi:ketosteroid isomerase-like protein
MSTEQNKQLVTDFFARLSANDLAGALSSLAEDATWWIAGKPESLPAAGSYHKEKIARLIGGMGSQLKDGMRMTVKGLIAEGDRVAVEAESYGELKNGRVYNQEYHFLITVRDGKISAVKEYLDTQHVFATWFQS